MLAKYKNLVNDREFRSKSRKISKKKWDVILAKWPKQKFHFYQISKFLSKVAFVIRLASLVRNRNCVKTVSKIPPHNKNLVIVCELRKINLEISFPGTITIYRLISENPKLSHDAVRKFSLSENFPLLKIRHTYANLALYIRFKIGIKGVRFGTDLSPDKECLMLWAKKWWYMALWRHTSGTFP